MTKPKQSWGKNSVRFRIISPHRHLNQNKLKWLKAIHPKSSATADTAGARLHSIRWRVAFRACALGVDRRAMALGDAAGFLIDYFFLSFFAAPFKTDRNEPELLSFTYAPGNFFSGEGGAATRKNTPKKIRGRHKN